MAYVGQPVWCGHSDIHPIPGTDLEAVRTCCAQPEGPWKPEHEHHYGAFVLRLKTDTERGAP